MKIWLDGSPKEKSYKCLTRDAAAVLALHAAGITDQEEIAKNVAYEGNSLGKALKFVARILRSKHPIVVACKQEAPVDLAARIRIPVRCNGCGRKIFVLPCMYCVSVRSGRVYTDSMSGDDVPSPRTPTGHLPGTPGKLEVLTERLRDGAALWHEDDAKAPSWEVASLEKAARGPDNEEAEDLDVEEPTDEMLRAIE